MTDLQALKKKVARVKLDLLAKASYLSEMLLLRKWVQHIVVDFRSFSC